MTDQTGDSKQVLYILGFARVSFEGLDEPESIGSAVKNCWVAGRQVELYKRRWTLSRILDEDDQGWHGRMGFVNSNEVDTLFFDAEDNDFVRGQAPSGVVVPFYLRRDGLITYQLISGLVREPTFIRAFSDLLSLDGTQAYRWRLDPFVQDVEYEDWRKSTTRVSRFDFRLERPNPSYHDDKIVEDLVEGMSAEYVRLTGAEASADGVDTSSDVFEQALDHVLRDYGKATLTGVDDDGNESVWTKAKRVVARIPARVKLLGQGGPEASLDKLKSGIDVLPQTSTVAPLEPEDDAYVG
ncbi:hypothetical protein [Rhodococcoides fascians]|uniref:hypothetical protein n=1 Tax=Rhodococcoides fascians TaxID=1828 RepID=UPI00050CDB7C|nr:hypothetical protein [Rhodococcus fascians]